MTAPDTPLGQLPVAAIDFESAGAAPGETDQPVQVGIVRVQTLLQEIDPQRDFFCSYIACDRPVRWSAAKVHGITTEMLADAPSYLSLWPQLNERLSDCVVLGHNPATEQRFLKTFPGHGFGPWLDTLALTRQAVPGLEDYSLSSICDTLGLTPELQALMPDRRWHDALFDAAASLAVLRFLVRELQMQDTPLASLLDAAKR